MSNIVPPDDLPENATVPQIVAALRRLFRRARGFVRLGGDLVGSPDAPRVRTETLQRAVAFVSPIPGRDGDDGEDGWTIPGLAGAAGATGATGAPGAAGLQGPPGADGEDSDAAWPTTPPMPFAWGSVTSGQYLQLSGTTLVGVTFAVLLATSGNVIENLGPGTAVGTITTSAGSVA